VEEDMRGSNELAKLHEKWSADLQQRIGMLPVNEAERVRLYVEMEKVSLLSEIAQGIALYHESHSNQKA
jgi:hypothetical protein